MISPDSSHAPLFDRGASLQGARQLMVLLAIANGAASVPGLDANQLRAPALDLDPLHAAAHETLKLAVRATAQALGVSDGELLDFSNPHCKAVELRGPNAAMRRIDRVWAGPSLTEIETSQRFCYTSPFYCLARWMLVRGTARLNGVTLKPYTAIQIPKDQELIMDPGTMALVRRAPVPTLIEAAQAAGLDLDALTARVLGQGDRWAATPIGKITLDAAQRTAYLEHRRIRLTPAETAMLTILCQNQGKILSRQQLAAAADTSERMVDRIIVQLRDKLGDGLIGTVYGAGYMLEIPEMPLKPD